jgi:YD repeat-containing protein
MAGMILGAVGSVAGNLEMGYDDAGQKTGIQWRRGKST